MVAPINFTRNHQRYALIYGATTHLIFLISVALMMRALYTGMQSCYGTLSGAPAFAVNLVLLVQFPLIHSLLLTPSGREFLGHLAPRPIATLLAPTTYVLIAAIQILCTFALWSPQGTVFWEPHGITCTLHQFAFLASWILLAKAMWDAHLGIQTGFIGWLTVWRDQLAINWPTFPVRGLFAICRQPIYLSFALTLWSGPLWTEDKLIIGTAWSFYSLLAPLAKESRYQRIFGDKFQRYKETVPYLPWMGRTHTNHRRRIRTIVPD